MNFPPDVESRLVEQAGKDSQVIQSIQWVLKNLTPDDMIRALTETSKHDGTRGGMFRASRLLREWADTIQAALEKGANS